MSDDRLLTAQELAHRWQVPVGHVYRLTREDKGLPVVKLGKYYRYSLRRIEAYENVGGTRQSLGKPGLGIFARSAEQVDRVHAACVGESNDGAGFQGSTAFPDPAVEGLPTYVNKVGQLVDSVPDAQVAGEGRADDLRRHRRPRLHGRLGLRPLPRQGRRPQATGATAMTDHRQVTVTLDLTRENVERLVRGGRMERPERAVLRAALDQTPSGEACERCRGTRRIQVTRPGGLPSTYPCPDCSQPSGEEGDGDGRSAVDAAWEESGRSALDELFEAITPRDGSMPDSFAAGMLAPHAWAEVKRLRAAAHPHDQEAPQVSSGQSSARDHDDGGEGVKPDDPPGDAGGQEGVAGSRSGGPSAQVSSGDGEAVTLTVCTVCGWPTKCRPSCSGKPGIGHSGPFREVEYRPSALTDEERERELKKLCDGFMGEYERAQSSTTRTMAAHKAKGVQAAIDLLRTLAGKEQR